MVEIIPSINVSEFSEAEERIKKVEDYVNWVHLDVSDGVFTKHVSWHEPKDLIDYKSKVKIEVHLMISNPEKQIESWLTDSVRSRHCD
jgi:pentose-5-phosphate-3-epimerase